MQMTANTISETQQQIMQPVSVSHHGSISMSVNPYTIRHIISEKNPHMNARPLASTCLSS